MIAPWMYWVMAPFLPITICLVVLIFRKPSTLSVDEHEHEVEKDRLKLENRKSPKL